MKRGRTSTVSIAAEVEQLRAALEGGRILVDQVSQGGLLDPEDEPRAWRAVAALLVLIDVRLEALGGALRFSAPIELVAARHNRAVAGAEELVLRRRRGRG